MQFAQELEHAIVNAMIVFDLVPKAMGTVKSAEDWHQRFDAFMELQFDNTCSRTGSSASARRRS
jgi:hypothetical protein